MRRRVLARPYFPTLRLEMRPLCLIQHRKRVPCLAPHQPLISSSDHASGFFRSFLWWTGEDFLYMMRISRFEWFQLCLHHLCRGIDRDVVSRIQHCCQDAVHFVLSKPGLEKTKPVSSGSKIPRLGRFTPSSTSHGLQQNPKYCSVLRFQFDQLTLISRALLPRCFHLNWREQLLENIGRSQFELVSPFQSLAILTCLVMLRPQHKRPHLIVSFLPLCCRFFQQYNTVRAIEINVNTVINILRTHLPNDVFDGASELRSTVARWVVAQVRGTLRNCCASNLASHGRSAMQDSMTCTSSSCDRLQKRCRFSKGHEPLNPIHPVESFKESMPGGPQKIDIAGGQDKTASRLSVFRRQ